MPRYRYLDRPAQNTRKNASPKAARPATSPTAVRGTSNRHMAYRTVRLQDGNRHGGVHQFVTSCGHTEPRWTVPPSHGPSGPWTPRLAVVLLANRFAYLQRESVDSHCDNQNCHGGDYTRDRSQHWCNVSHFCPLADLLLGLKTRAHRKGGAIPQRRRKSGIGFSTSVSSIARR